MDRRAPPSVAVPPTTRTRPSASTAWPAQKRSAAAFGTWVTLPVGGIEHVLLAAAGEVALEEQDLAGGRERGVDRDRRAAGSAGPHCPTCDGSAAPLLTVTVIAGSTVAMLPARVAGACRERVRAVGGTRSCPRTSRRARWCPRRPARDPSSRNWTPGDADVVARVGLDADGPGDGGSRRRRGDTDTVGAVSSACGRGHDLGVRRVRDVAGRVVGLDRVGVAGAGGEAGVGERGRADLSHLRAVAEDPVAGDAEVVGARRPAQGGAGRGHRVGLEARRGRRGLRVGTGRRGLDRRRSSSDRRSARCR